MVVDPETFREHLRALRRYFLPVSLSEWLGEGEGVPVSGARYAAITFDDGWRDNYEYAFPILQEEQWPATIFLVSDMVGTNDSFWPERLAWVLEKVGGMDFETVLRTRELKWLATVGLTRDIRSCLPNPEALDRIISSAKRFDDAELTKRVIAMERLLGWDSRDLSPDILDWDQVREMTASGLVELGSHSRRHTRLLPGLSTEQIEDEIVGSRMSIEEQTGRPVRLFCYPNGNVTPQARRVVEQHYTGACSTTSGWNTADTDRYMLKRIGVHQDITSTQSRFLARVSGWL